MLSFLSIETKLDEKESLWGERPHVVGHTNDWKLKVCFSSQSFSYPTETVEYDKKG